MNDPISPRKARGWPLFAISVLILLLAGFLVLRVRKKEDIPLIVKPPAAPAGADRRSPGSADPELDRDLKALKEALDAKRWDDAAAAFEEVRKRKPDAPELK